MSTILYIDGENLFHKIREVLKTESIDKESVDLANINLEKLLTIPLNGLNVKRKIFYASRLHYHAESKEKSLQLLKFQRKLRNTLSNQNFEFIFAGNVRAQKVGSKTIFHEKGVDVKIAVDLVAHACDKKVKTAILCSSDSDLQPAVKEAKARNVQLIYLGFETMPNKGLTHTCDRTILIRNSEVLGIFTK